MRDPTEMQAKGICPCCRKVLSRDVVRMRDDQTPHAQDSVQLHYKSYGEETLTVPKNIQSLDLSGKHIKSIDLTPLSSCSSLQALNLFQNQLQSIDLKPLSSCSSLQSLGLSENQLQNIDLKPLSSCSGLQSLHISRNRLRSIDLKPLSSCSGLQSLGLSEIQLQSIDLSPLSSCSSLQTLHLSWNPLQSIDLTPLASCHSLQYLDLGRTQLQSIDLTPLVSCTSLQTLRLFQNQLQSIDLKPLTSCSSLRVISLGRNQLQSIDLTPLAACTDLRYVDLGGNQLQNVIRALLRETLQLIAPQTLVIGNYNVRTAEGQVSSIPDMTVLSRVVDALWPGPGPSERWRAHAVVQDVVERLGLGWLGVLDTEPPAVMAVMNGARDDEQRANSIIDLMCQQIDRGGTTIGLDVERMTEHGELAVRVQRTLDLRRTEMASTGVHVNRDGTADLLGLWLTAYGHGMLSAMGLGTKCNVAELEQVKDAVFELGFTLNIAEGGLTIPSNISEPLCVYVWMLADFRAKEKKRR